MKPQDVLFLIILIGLLVVKKPRLLVWTGLLCFLFSIPLFYYWIFFTAERLVAYASGFLFAAVIELWITGKK